MNEREEALNQALKLIEKEYGKGSVMKLGAEPEKIEVISSGSISLDKALGVGGYPKGRIIEIYGPESSGKTTFALHAIMSGREQLIFCPGFKQWRQTFHFKSNFDLLRELIDHFLQGKLRL